MIKTNSNLMNIEDALIIVDSILPGRSLNNIQELLFRQTWEGKTYLAIAENSGYDASYVRDVGYKLWQTLSRAFGERVTKKNLQVVLRRYAAKMAANSPHVSSSGIYDSPYEFKRNEPGLSAAIGSLASPFNPLNLQTLPGAGWQNLTNSNQIGQLSSNISPATYNPYHAIDNPRAESMAIAASETTDKISGNINRNVNQDNFANRHAGVNLVPEHQNNQSDQLSPQTYTTPDLAGQTVSHAIEQTPRQDWGSAIDTSDFVGRDRQLQQLQQWLIEDRSRLIGILGFGGVGKTSLAAQIADRVQGEFDFLIWRSLRHAPALVDILRDLVSFLAPQKVAALPGHADRLLLLLLDCLRQHRCLIILDQVEAIMRPGDRNGFYLPGYEGYGDLFKQIGATRHQSCLLFTSREKPYELITTSNNHQAIALLQLKGLDLAAAKQLSVLKKLSKSNDSQAIAVLSEEYQANPQLLKAAGRLIQELFDGAIDPFLAQDAAVFGEVRHLVEQQYDRLSGVEQRVMFWLAILPTPVMVEQLAQVLLPSTTQAELLETITALHWRSLIFKQDQGFALPSIVSKYVTNLLLEAAYTAITQTSYDFLISFALYLPRQILKNPGAIVSEPPTPQPLLPTFKPLIARLIAHFGSKRSLGNKLSQMLCQVSKLSNRMGNRLDHVLSPSQPNTGYAQENLIALLRQLQLDSPGNDFAHLPIWQAYLQEILTRRSPLSPTQHDMQSDNTDNLDDQKTANDLNAAIELGDLRDLNDLTDLTELAANPKSRISSDQVTTEILAITFSPDGKVLACSNSDCSIKLRHSSSGECIATLVGHSQPVFATTFSPDGQILASGSHDQTIRLWDIQTGECLKTLKVAGVAVVRNRGQSQSPSGSDQNPRNTQNPPQNPQYEGSVLPKGAIQDLGKPAIKLLNNAGTGDR
jgi:hypothetical protein